MKFACVFASILLATVLTCEPSRAQAVRESLLLLPGPDNPRNSEGDFIQLKDGTLLLVYTHFTGDKSRDDSPAYLAARRSTDAGHTWTARDETIVPREGKQNVMSVSLLRLADGRIGMWYLVKNSLRDCRPFVRFSGDEGKTWSDAKPCAPAESGYYAVNNGRVVQLRSGTHPGRLLIPCEWFEWERSQRGVSFVYYSDDGGQTWTKSKTVLESPSRDDRHGLQEPVVVELRDGRVMMLCRTAMGAHFRSDTADGGVTWSPPVRTDFVAPNSPSSVKRIPKTGDLLILWNDHRNTPHEPSARWNQRTPFTAAISRDDGKTWEKRRNLLDDPAGCYCYAAITFIDDRVLIATCAGRPNPPGAEGLNTLEVLDVDVDWFYR